MELSEFEYYQLVCCTKKKPLEINGQVIVFEFTGKAYNENYPDKFLNNIVGDITTLSKNKVEGCFQLIDVTGNCDLEMFKIVSWESFFVKVITHKECCDCLPEKEQPRVINLETLYVDKPKDPCAHIYSQYTDYVWHDAIKRMEGITLCCTPSKIKTIVEYQHLVLDRQEDKTACCPPCVQVDLYFPEGLIGEYSYVNCSGEVVTVDIEALEDTTVRVCVLVDSFELTTFTGTGTGFTATPLSIPCT